MSKNITLNINDAKSTVETLQIHTQSGAPVHVPAQAVVKILSCVNKFYYG